MLNNLYICFLVRGPLNNLSMLMKPRYIVLGLLLFPLFLMGQGPMKNAEVLFHFTDFDGKPMPDEQLVIINQSTGREYKGKTDKNGELTLNLPKGAKYGVKYYALDGVVDYDPFTIPDQPGKISFKYSLQYKRSETKVFRLENVYFDTDKATLRPESYPALDNLVRALRAKPSMKIEIAGHTDNVGDDTYNRRLSQRRAEAVRDYLIKKGIKAERLVARGYGETKPVANNDTPEGRQKNRRTEIHILEE